MKEILERDRGRCVAVGECGLDYEHEYSPVEDQSDVFEQQLALAVEMQKPLFLHERKAHDDFKKMLGDYIEQLPAKKWLAFTVLPAIVRLCKITSIWGVPLASPDGLQVTRTEIWWKHCKRLAGMFCATV